MNKVKARLKEIYSYRASYIMMAPFLFLFFLFVVWPVIMSIGMSFTSFNVFDTPRFIGFDNYIKLFFHG